ncbi:MAG: sensor histidine kinase [Bacteroidetes bacterium]|nr:sensor histidine kinase [Bacteroidota bacterium]
MHASVTDFLLDIIQNSIEAEAAVVNIVLDQTETVFACSITDDGKGMTKDELNQIQNPFYTDGKKHSARKVGLGIPFLIQAAETAGGNVTIRSEKGKGTTCRFSFDPTHIDCPPLGDVPGTFLAAVSYPGDHELVIDRSISRLGEKHSYKIARSELIEAVGSLSLAGSLSLVKLFLGSQENSVMDQVDGRE